MLTYFHLLVKQLLTIKLNLNCALLCHSSWKNQYTYCRVTNFWGCKILWTLWIFRISKIFILKTFILKNKSPLIIPFLKLVKPFFVQLPFHWNKKPAVYFSSYLSGKPLIQLQNYVTQHRMCLTTHDQATHK